MAKKKKTQKSGIKKRQQAKQVKRTKIKKSNKPVAQKKMSMGKLKKSLAQVPKMVFEPEFSQIAYEKEVMETAQASSDKLPDQIQEACTETVTNNVVQALKDMEVRANTDKDAVLAINAKAMVYYMETEKSPAFMNQITVGLYLKNAFEYFQQGEEITLDNVIEKVQEYETEWLDYIQEKAEQAAGAEEEMPAVSMDEEDEDIIEASPFESFREKMVAYLSKEGKQDEDTIERVDEDMEAFLDDYLAEEGVTAVDAVTPAHLNGFLGEWFIENMNPTKDDMEAMIASIDICFEYAKASSQMDSLNWNTLKIVLDGKEQFLEKL